MKTIFLSLIMLMYVGSSIAQQKKLYYIKLETIQNQVLKGVFYGINDSSFVVISNKTDTSFFTFAKVKKLKVYEKGILIPSLLTGAGTVGLLSLAVGPLAVPFLILGVPVGLAVGYGVSSVVSVKKRFRNFQASDSSLIRRELQPYAQNNQ